MLGWSDCEEGSVAGSGQGKSCRRNGGGLRDIGGLRDGGGSRDVGGSRDTGKEIQM